MSDSPSTLPPRPSLEQLRKQAKDRLDTMPGAKLADAQFALARDYGFDSWPKLVHHVEALASPEVQQQEQIARDMVAVRRSGDEDAARRLNDLFHSALTVDQIRDFLRDRLFHLPGGAERIARFDLNDARLLVARLYAFEDWGALVSASTGAARADPLGISSTPPFHKIDEARGIISPRQPMSARDWDVLIGVIMDRGLTGVEANNMMDDAALAKLASVAPHLTILKLHGSDRLTDDGLRHLAAFRDLEEVELGGWKNPMTDVGFAGLRGLPRLRIVKGVWSRRITDAGVANTLASCGALEDVNLMGAEAVGDGAIAALSGNTHLQRLFTGDAVTDAGLQRLHDIPRFKRWHDGEPRYSLMEFEAGPTYFGARGTFTTAGVRALQGLDGLFALKLDWQKDAVQSSALGLLSSLANLGFLGIDGDRCDDEAMRQIGRLPHLRMLLAQEPVAGDDGFAGLSRSATLEYLWGRECPKLTGRGFSAMAEMPSLKGLGVSCKYVDDQALATLPRFPSLRALMPMDVQDDGFRHVGRCERLEELWCMYCSDTGDRATEHISGLRLKTYYAGGTKMTDRSLDMLSRMTLLERILLHYCRRVTDAGLRMLTGLPHLRELSVEGCPNVTRMGLAGFPARVRVSYASV
jgi:hypothetical protein